VTLAQITFSIDSSRWLRPLTLMTMPSMAMLTVSKVSDISLSSASLADLMFSECSSRILTSVSLS
jgi:hypothetical protein